MGRYKKGQKHVRADMWEKAGGIDVVAEALIKANICKDNAYSSKIWSQLSRTLFQEDNYKNRLWLWVAWTHNRKGLRDRVHMATGESNVITPILPNPVTHDMKSQKQGKDMAHESTQYDRENLDRLTDATWNPDTDSEDLNSPAEASKLQSRKPKPELGPDIKSDATDNPNTDSEDLNSPAEASKLQSRKAKPELGPNTMSDATDNPDTDSEDLNSPAEGSKLQTSEAKANVWRQCGKVKKSFTISVSKKSWNKIKPQKGSSKLQKTWTDCLYNKFKKKNPCCTLAFKYQHVKADKSRKKNSPYLHISAACTFASCKAKYSFQIPKKPPKHDKHVNILVKRTGHITHKLSEKRCRPATHLKRGRIAKSLMHGPSEYYYSKLQSTPKAQILAGNMSECLNKNVLKVIGSEMRKREAGHSEVLVEIQLMQQIMKECDSSYYKLPGYIQLVCTNPFIVHLYTELGISILVHHLRSKLPVCLYLDATGGVVSRIPYQPKRVLYYALTLPGKGRDVPPLPVCEMLSNDHSVPPISFWLMQFALHLSKYTQLTVHQIETDYSWALIQGVLGAFNKEHIMSYLNRAHELCMGKKTWDEIKSVTVLHICSAHILKAVRQAICRQTEDKGLRDFATFAFARLQNASSMSEARVLFHALCTLLITPQNTDSVKETLSTLTDLISRSPDDIQEDTVQSEDCEVRESEDRRHAMSIIASSPFSKFFQQVMTEVNDKAASETSVSKEKNAYFCPGIIKVLFDTYLAIFPLWSGLLLGDLRRYVSHGGQDIVPLQKLSGKKRDTNCHVENWFAILKHSIMQSKKKVRPGTFIRKMYQSLQARYTDHVLHHHLPQELLVRPGPPTNLEQAQETWRKKNEERYTASKSKYFSVPKTVPVPHGKKKICKDVKHIQVTSENTYALADELLAELTKLKNLGSQELRPDESNTIIISSDDDTRHVAEDIPTHKEGEDMIYKNDTTKTLRNTNDDTSHIPTEEGSVEKEIEDPKNDTVCLKVSKTDACHSPTEVYSPEEEIEKLWARGMASETIVAIVRSLDHELEYTLREKELLTLKPHNWLYGEAIECYFRALLNKSGKDLYQLSHYNTHAIINGTKEQRERQGLRNVNFERYDGVIAAININRSHWRLVYLHTQTNTIYVADPQSGTHELALARHACQQFGEYFRMRGKKLGTEQWVDIKWKPGKLHHTFQEDGYSCGVFVMMMAKQVVEDFPKIPDSINIDPSKESMCNFRKYVAKELFLAAVPKEEYCCVCGVRDISGEEHCDWIQCDVCKRWYHLSCLKMALPPTHHAWFCQLCC